MKRIVLIVVVTAIAWAGFAFFAKQTGSEAHAHEEHEPEEVDFDHIPLTAKQVSTVDLKMGGGCGARDGCYHRSERIARTACTGDG